MAFTFGSTGGFGQQNQQQQTPGQQQNQTPAFGGFGGGAFGSTTPATGFGQPQQQQSTGLFGGGGFGSTANATPAFGAANTSTPGGAGGGLFGSQNASSTPAFGGGAGSSGFSFGTQQPSTGGGLFGSSTGGGAFGSSGGAFGAKPGGIGSGLSVGGNNNTQDPNSTTKPNPAVPPPQNGTADAPSDPANPNRFVLWKDERSGDMMGADGKVAPITGEKLNYDSIVAFPMYWHISPEELRVQDYSQGRKTAPAASTGFGGGFGQSTSTPAFGSSGTSAFGQSTSTPGGGLFGAKPAGTTGGGLFGSAGASGTTGTGAFGKPATTTAFGQPATGTTGGGLFGSAGQAGTSAFGAPAASGTTGFGGFGQNAQQQNKPAFSFGGAQAQPATGGGLFGQSNTSTPAFGQAAAQPASSGFSFGQNNTSSTSGGLFGAKPAGTGLFGGGTTGTDNKPSFSFGGASNTTQPSTGLFGQQNQPQTQQPAAGGGLFGNLGQSTSTFGQNTSTTGGGLFGNTAAKPAGTGLFGGGASTTGTTSAPSFSFGNNNNTNTQQAGQTGGTGLGGGLFGGGGGSLFGNNQQQNNNQQQQPQAGGGGLFGGGASTFGAGSTGGGLFGGLGQNQNQQQQQQPQQQSTGLFGSTAPSLGGSTGFGGFGQSQNNNLMQNSQSSLLGQSQQAPLQPLNLSIDQNPYGNNPIFANVQPAKPAEGPRAYDADQPKKQLPLHISYRGTPRSSVKINKLRGFATSASSPGGLGASRFGSPATPGTPLVNSLSRPGTASPAPGSALDLSFSLPPQAFAARPSVKKLIIDKKHRENPDLLFGRGRASGTATPVGEQTPSQTKERAVFNPDAETAERSSASVPLSRDGSRTTSTSKGKAPVSSGAQVNEKANGRPAQPNKPLEEGDYYTKPDFKVLQSMSDEDLSEVHDFVVGRVGYGEICWLEPVDLTGLASLRELLDKVVVIKDKEVMVYPDEYDDEKPEVGQGLNVPAVISLKNCWPLDRATREPLKDPNHQRVKQHIRKLEKKEDTEFVDYEAATGTWTFKVAHFSRYGLDSDDEEGDETMQDGQETNSPAASRKAALQDRSSRKVTKKPRVTDSPVSDTTEDDIDDVDYDDEAPPQATLDDDPMEDESANERSFSRTPVRRSASHPALQEETDENLESDEEPRRRKRSVVVPTPRVPQRRDLRNLRQVTQSATSRAGSEPSHQKPLPQRLGLEPKKLAVMQASFFSKPRKDEQAAEQAIVVRHAPQREPKQLLEAPTRSAPAPATPAAPVEEEQYVPQYRPLRQWKAIPLEQSLIHGKEGKVLDAGLMLGRSFRATFGPQGQLVTVGGLSSLSMKGDAVPQTQVNVIKPRLFVSAPSTERDQAARTLQVQHSHTKIDAEDDMLPFATTLPSLRFHHFAGAFQSQDSSSEALLWRLGNALFDEIDLGLSDTAMPETVDRVSKLRRRNAFSTWLRDAVAPAVEQDLRRIATGLAETRAPATIFALLTGNQVERACQAALAEGDVRLATLLSQAGGDDEFRADIDLQLAKWRDQRVDPLISKEYRKIYELLSGNVVSAPGIKGASKVDTSESIMIGEGLDWKRAFALRFWYAEFEASVTEALKRYSNDASQDSQLAQPLPEYKLDREAVDWAIPDADTVRDVIYEVISLYSDVSKSLENALSPRTSASSPFAYRQAWHLYQLLARSLQVREFEDVDVHGFSATSQTIIENYADELEKLSMWEWAAFVLLHLIDSGSREKAVRELLARHASHIDQNAEAFLVDNLSIPRRFLDEARELYAEQDDNGKDSS